MKKKIFSTLSITILVIGTIIGAFVWSYYRSIPNDTGLPPTRETSKLDPGGSGTETETSLGRYLPLGNPSNAVFDQSSPNNYLLTGEHFSLSYNREKGIANWVMWKLDKDSLGKSIRQNDFRSDVRLPQRWPKITPFDYSNSGYDRGHICPSADRSQSEDANSATFLMTNIAPQKVDMNSGPWEKLERYSRSLSRRKATLYIIAGQYGQYGKIRNKITIPTNFWKIVMVVPDGADINQNTRVIAVDIPNINGIGDTNWRNYRTTVRGIEQKTGYIFFTALPDDIQSVLKSKIDR